MPLAPDDPAREKIKQLRESKATPEQVMEAMETFEVPAHYLVKALSPGHAKLIVGELLQHMIDTHLEPGTFAISSVEEPTALEWLDGPLFGGDLNG